MEAHAIRRRLSATATSCVCHVCLVLILVWISSSTPGRSSSSYQVTHVFVQPAEAAADGPPVIAQDAVPDDLVDAQRNAPSELSLPGFTLDVSKVALRAEALFPFLTPGVSLAQFSLAVPRTTGDSLPNPLAPRRDEARSETGRPPLALRDRALQALVDKTWSRRERWNAFQRIASLALTHNADVGRLPALLQAYLDQNALQPYVDTKIRDPRLWAQLTLAADHADFIAFIGRYASAHPSTKATTELLFLLDKLAQGSLDALIVLLDTDPQQDLAWTRDGSHGAYELIAGLRKYYSRQLERRRLKSIDELRIYYGEVRLAILKGIVRATPHGFRANDARFLIGAIYWKEGRLPEAERAWRDLTVDPTDSQVAAYSEILAAMQAKIGANDRSYVHRVDNILRAQQGRWIMFSFDRLRQFGYHFDTF